jgi:hypothetical protein
VQRDPISAATRTAIVSLALLGAAPYTARSDWTLGTDAHVLHDNNVFNGESSPDIVADTIVGARLSVFQLFPLGEGYSVSVGGDLSGESFHRFDGLSNASVGGTLTLKKKWGLGAFAPWVRAGVSIARSDYEDDYRDASIYRATLAAGRRIDERWNLWADLAFERRAAATQEQQLPGISGDAYSQDGRTVSANVEYALNETTFLSVGVSARHGDVVSTTADEDRIYLSARAIAEDPAFGPDAYAYKLTGTTYGFMLGINYSPTPHMLLECGFRRLDTQAEGGNGYTKSMPEIAWSYRF